MKRTPIVIPMLLLMSVSLVGAARADATPRTGGDPRTEIVGYGDLDLTHPSGVDALDRRISQAAERVCRSAGVRDIYSQMAERQCRFRARRGAIAQRNHALALAQPGEVQLSSRR
jgi:UrcA family protein